MQNYVLASKSDTPFVNLNMKIVVQPNHVPFYFRPRRLSYSEKEQVHKILDDLLTRGIIRKSNSQYSSPIVLVRKKNGSIRMCVDYRELNKITARDNYPIPRIDDQLDSLRDKRVSTRLDLKVAFHHIEVDEESIKFTSFVTPLGQFEYMLVPFGLKNSPAMFMRFINAAFRELLDEQKVVIYMDDILVAIATVERNLDVLNEVYNVLNKNLLTLRLDKYSFLKSKITYLGYEVDADGIRESIENIKALVDFPIPTNYKHLHSFLGLASYFRRFTRNFALLTKPLWDLLKQEKHKLKFVFGVEQLSSFEEIKSILSSKPILCIHSPYLETQLHCDASSVGLASI